MEDYFNRFRNAVRLHYCLSNGISAPFQDAPIGPLNKYINHLNFKLNLLQHMHTDILQDLSPPKIKIIILLILNLYLLFLYNLQTQCHIVDCDLNHENNLFISIFFIRI